MIRLLCILVLLLSVIFVHGGQVNLFNSGPYTIKVTRIEKCPNQGTGEVSFDTKISKKSPKQYVLNGKWAWPYDVDTAMSTTIDIYRWSPPAGWMPVAFQYTTKDMCKELDELFPDMWKGLSQKNGQKDACPLKNGNYTINDWILTLKLPTDSLVYGSYRADFSFLKNRMSRIGCMSMFGEVLPL